MNNHNRVQSVKQSWLLINSLHSIGQTIGTLNQKLRRCKIGSKKSNHYEQIRNKLMNEQADISHEIKMNFYYLLSSEEQSEFLND